eukprot:2675898-Rhodomonas_salina.2
MNRYLPAREPLGVGSCICLWKCGIRCCLLAHVALVHCSRSIRRQSCGNLDPRVPNFIFLKPKPEYFKFNGGGKVCGVTSARLIEWGWRRTESRDLGRTIFLLFLGSVSPHFVVLLGNTFGISGSPVECLKLPVGSLCCTRLEKY